MPNPTFVPVLATGGDPVFDTVTVVTATATSSVVVDSDGTATQVVDRGSTANYAAFVWRTAGVDRWALQMTNDGTNDFKLTDSANGVTVLRIVPGAVPVLTMTGTLAASEAADTAVVLSGIVSGDTFDRFRMRADGRLDWGSGALARDTSLYRSAAARLATDGSLSLAVAGGGLLIKEGTNACAGAATLVAGTVVVPTTKVTATSRIQLTVQSLGTVTTPKAIGVTARTAGTSFTITSADATDTSVVAWTIIEPAP